MITKTWQEIEAAAKQGSALLFPIGVIEEHGPHFPLSWKYYRYVKEHPVCAWSIPTNILYAGKDNLQSREVVKGFAERFGCAVTISEDSEHPFMEAKDGPVVDRWLQENLQ